MAREFAAPLQSSAGAVAVARGDDSVALGEPEAEPVDAAADPGTEVVLQAARKTAATDAIHHRSEPVRSFGTRSALIVPSAVDRVEKFMACPSASRLDPL
jgi:hypothetical protein